MFTLCGSVQVCIRAFSMLELFVSSVKAVWLRFLCECHIMCLLDNMHNSYEQHPICHGESVILAILAWYLMYSGGGRWPLIHSVDVLG